MTVELRTTRKLKSPRCLGCGRYMIAVKDKIAGKKTGYLWRCVCSPKVDVSIG